ncbi:MAG: hypothetical protein ACT4P7_23650 [Gemmatimonadaceae bacterium]
MLSRKLPGAVRDWRWAWLFPAARDSYDRSSGRRVRFPVHNATIQRAITAAVIKAGINKRVTAHTFRHNADCRIMPHRAGGKAISVGDLARWWPGKSA